MRKHLVALLLVSVGVLLILSWFGGWWTTPPTPVPSGPTRAPSSSVWMGWIDPAVLEWLPVAIVTVVAIASLGVASKFQGLAKAAAMAFIVVAYAFVLAYMPAVYTRFGGCATSDTICINARNDAVAAQAAAEQQRRKENMLREEQRARRVARSPQCPGKVIRDHSLTRAWETLNPHGCDFAFERKLGNIELSGPQGNFSTTQVGGHADNRIAIHVRAEGSAAVIDYMLCPPGMGPRDSSYQCRSYSPSVPYGLFNAVFGKH